MSGKIFIGTSGYNYPNWGHGAFYPENLREREWLEYYCTKFTTVELNVTFYRLPNESAFQGWYRRTSVKFTFAVKGSRFITHIKRLRESGPSLKLFFGRTLLLKEKLGVVLWQLPSSFTIDMKMLNAFIKLLKRYPSRNAFEFRDKSWLKEDVYDLLGEHEMTLCDHDWPGQSATCPETLPFLYVRRHGSSSLYQGSYSDRQLIREAQRAFRCTKEGKDVFVYFNNTSEGDAIKDGLRLKTLFSRIESGKKEGR